MDFSAPTIAIIKHNNPCGLASHKDLTEAYRRALEGDPVSAFGGVVACNRPIDLAAATEMDKTHFDAIIAPDYDEKALELFKRKKNLRLLSLPSAQFSVPSLSLRHISGGFLVQTPDIISEKEFTPRTVTERAPTKAEMEQLAFVWKAVKNIKSNAIVLVKDEALLGMGAGQPSRVVSVKIALEKAGDKAKGSVLGSDAFFPFPDGVELAAKGGVTAIIQPGGSVKDDEAIVTANRYNMAMVFTGARHFKH
jgi:phosphoribosylaminoimidazolecarboxamide formyltransferase/IMP cyclohydrolase